MIVDLGPRAVSVTSDEPTAVFQATAMRTVELIPKREHSETRRALVELRRFQGGLAPHALLGGGVGIPLVAEVGVAVKGDFGVECMHLAGGLEDQRVDFHQVGVAVDVRGVELAQDVDRTLGGIRVEVGGCLLYTSPSPRD